MQNRYVGDIGDFGKYGLLRALCHGRQLGVAWYLCPDETHNEDGGSVDYLCKPDEWRSVDPELFDGMREIVDSGHRCVGSVEESGLLPSTAIFASETLRFCTCSNPKRENGGASGSSGSSAGCRPATSCSPTPTTACIPTTSSGTPAGNTGSGCHCARPCDCATAGVPRSSTITTTVRVHTPSRSGTGRTSCRVESTPSTGGGEATALSSSPMPTSQWLTP